MSDLPFIFGAQYYRAPTPEPECWEQDLRRMRELGFNAVKFWVQWRWSHREQERFYFDDVDRLMDLAAENELGVTLNTIFDVSPLWLFDLYPDAKQVDASGRTVEPYTVSHRQVGGHPGPCYRHERALEERRRFMLAAVDHFREHPAMSMWDVWNEPEQAFQARRPDMQTLVCYCDCCGRSFYEWLQRKYGSLDRLNGVWGRCYEAWEQVELPRGGGTVTDFVDWREFHLDTMTEEAKWRLDMTRTLDPDHPVYLHVVPNTMEPFNAVTCVDDFALAEHCDVFAATMNGGPVFPSQVLSAARGKICYNVESHVNFGSIGMHQRMLSREELLADFIPQVGLGVKGFLFWQYRSEVLGAESPAWGLVKLDGSDRPVTRAAREFWSTLRPHADALMKATPSAPQIGIWKSRKNEVFHLATNGSLDSLRQGVEGYIHLLHNHSYPFRMVSGRMLAEGELGDLKLLIMPACYYVTEDEATALDAWVRSGGVLLCEAHLAGYNGTTGRHSRRLPGCGLSESWGIVEEDSTSSFHLRLERTEAFEQSLPEDVRKALDGLGTSGGRFFPIRLTDGSYAWGAHRYAVLEGGTSEGCFDGERACIVSTQVGEGFVLYAGTNLGEGASQGGDGLLSLLRRCADRAGLSPTMHASAELPGTVHVDVLSDDTGPRFLAVVSQADRDQVLTLAGEGTWRGLFTGAVWTLDGETAVDVAAGMAELLVRDQCPRG